MKRTCAITFVAISAVLLAGCDISANSAEEKLIAQAPVADSAEEASSPASESEADAEVVETETDLAAEKPANEAPEVTKVSGQLIGGDGKAVSGGVVYFIFQNRLNEIPHTNPLDKVKAMTEVAVGVDAQGSFTLRMKPGNFAMVYDPNETEVPTEPGSESMTVVKRSTPEQIQARIAAIKENAAKGLPISNGKLGDAFLIENRYVRPPISNFGEMQLQSDAVVTVKALNDSGELINFPATLRLRGKNGDIMLPHTPGLSTRAQYAFYDLMPQSYQVYAIGSRPRPGAGDEVTTPTITNDQFIFTGESLTQEVTVELPG